MPTLDSELLVDPAESFTCEWLETNGLGSYAMGTPVFLNTRKYHSLLTVRPDSLAERHNLVSHYDMEVEWAGTVNRVSTNQFPAVFHPRGFESAHSFELNLHPETTFRFQDIEVSVGILMLYGRNTTIMKVEVSSRTAGKSLSEGRSISERTSVSGDASTEGVLRIRPFLAYREHHGLSVENSHARLEAHLLRQSEVERGIKLDPYDGMPPVFIYASSPTVFHAEPDWYRGFHYEREKERGYDFNEDLMTPGAIEIPFSKGEPIYIVASTEEAGDEDGDGRADYPTGAGALFEAELERRNIERRRLESHFEPVIQTRDMSAAVMLSEQSRHFLISAERDGMPSIIAGFPWFGEWGRDTMIAIEGLALDTGRYDEALGILSTFAQNERDGLFPNQLSVSGNSSYNTIDASLWFFHAVDRYVQVSVDRDGALSKLFPTMERIVSAYFEGRVPHAEIRDDGTLLAGSADTQLTWMDASVSGVPVTPRYGLPIEIEALWYNALCVYDRFAGERYGSDGRTGDRPAGDGYGLAKKVGETIAKLEKNLPDLFWLDEGYLADVIYPQGSKDRSIRPNQVIALALSHCAFSNEQAQRILNIVEEHLLSPCGMRTLSSTSSGYAPFYRGNQADRDRAYHQGTVWPWLIGNYSDACAKYFGVESEQAAKLKEHVDAFVSNHANVFGLGSISEVFDAERPYSPGGCPMQAWSVAGILHAIIVLQDASR